MMPSARVVPIGDGNSLAGAAFDAIAPEYDETFTNSVIGRAQRSAVWRGLQGAFPERGCILEINCGTGEDALCLAQSGYSVFACDASKGMIDIAKKRLLDDDVDLPVTFLHLPIERLDELESEFPFDGALSNFSGLNCVEDMGKVSESLARLVREGGRFMLCMSTRFCAVEIMHYAWRGRWKKAFRRCTGRSIALLGGAELPIYYPTVRQVSRQFQPYFDLISYVGVGVAIPPSYCEGWACRHPQIFKILDTIEARVARLPLFRVTGDHVLMCFERVSR